MPDARDKLFAAEVALRSRADTIRRKWPKSALKEPHIPEASKYHYREENEVADQIDLAADAIVFLKAEENTDCLDRFITFMRKRAHE